MGAYVSLPTWWRSNDSRYRLVLGKCPECGAHNFPAEGVCASCNADADFEEVEPEGAGTVQAVTVISGGAPPEFDEYQTREGAFATGIIELAEGARLPGMFCDCDPNDISRGDRVEAVVRRLYEQEGVPRYGVKFRPVE
ncbi:Zn-ribbon domain-containing OB-fold protein [Salarchaeum japonicum]|uniref:Zn-ribbon domain-containing OB-fold protein n=1 Tax=Salarchaeum japonicum TaxID=555573 RepID=UPI003C769240